MKKLVVKLFILIVATVNASPKSILSIKDINKTTKGDFFNVHFEGDIVVSDDDKDILSISENGFIEIKKSSFGIVRRLVIKSNDNGEIVKQFFIRGTKQDFIPKGQKWLAKILPEIVKETILGAKSRLNRFYKTGGLNLVLEEIDNLKEDYVKSKYLEILLQKELQSNELNSILKRMKKLIEDENHLIKILEERQNIFLQITKVEISYINLISEFKTDYYKFTLLKNAIKNEGLFFKKLNSIMTISKSIEEENYVARLCYDLIDFRGINNNTIETILSLLKQISHEEYYSNEVVKKLVVKNLEISFLRRILQFITESPNKESNAIAFYENLSLNATHSENDILEILVGVSSNVDSSIGLYNSLLGLSEIVKNSSEKIKMQYLKSAEALKPEYEHYYNKVSKAIQK